MTPKRHLIDLALLISYRQIIKVFFREKTKSCLRHRHHSGLSGGGANNVRENDVRKNKILKVFLIFLQIDLYFRGTNKCVEIILGETQLKSLYWITWMEKKLKRRTK